MSDRETLTNNWYVRQEAERVHTLLAVAQGTRRVPTLAEVVQSLATCIRALEAYPGSEFAQDGGFVVTRSRGENVVYQIHVTAAEVQTWKIPLAEKMAEPKWSGEDRARLETMRDELDAEMADPTREGIHGL